MLAPLVAVEVELEQVGDEYRLVMAGPVHLSPALTLCDVRPEEQQDWTKGWRPGWRAGDLRRMGADIETLLADLGFATVGTPNPSALDAEFPRNREGAHNVAIVSRAPGRAARPKGCVRSCVSCEPAQRRCRTRRSVSSACPTPRGCPHGQTVA